MDLRGRRRETMAPFIGPQRSIIRHGRLLDVLMSRTHCRLITVAFIIPAQQGASSSFPSLSLFSLSLSHRAKNPISNKSPVFAWRWRDFEPRALYCAWQASRILREKNADYG